MIKRIVVVIALLVVVALFLLGFRTPSISENHGIVDTHLYLNDSSQSQPLVVAFGGGSGGNDWERNYLKEKRNEFLRRGYAVLAIGYFNTENSPGSLDRISLNAISDTILSIVNAHPRIDKTKIVLMGASKGGELVLNLASRFPHFKAVIALSASHVSFPALTLSANTSSWMFNAAEVAYVPAPYKTIFPTIQGDLHRAFSMMLEDEEAVRLAEIEVEKINGPILILSAQSDEQWPATFMSQQIVKRLKNKNFKYYFEHIELVGGHIEPLNHFDKVYSFLDEHIASK